MEPQQRAHLHVTLGFLHDADTPRLAEAAALLSGRPWPTPTIGPTGEVRHGSWEPRKAPDYHYRENLVQKREQVRLGVENTPELTAAHHGGPRHRRSGILAAPHPRPGTGGLPPSRTRRPCTSRRSRRPHPAWKCNRR
ncbi:hypothetical protein ACFV3R_32240 [Streptomyces sp. NPDC059740]|uniref:hypothetical protein n=1 Tax=Streptomyces sp. NPDC059740 TaxID=3346926 RepID=UPI0036594E72